MTDDYDSLKAGQRVSSMWLALAEQLSGAVPDIVIADDPAKALRWATYAEACFWKATGESDTHDIKDVLHPVSSPPVRGDHEAQTIHHNSRASGRTI